jgi:hypothetical protein
MVSSGMLRCVALVRTAVSEEPSASFIILRSVRRLLVAASVVPRSQILVTLFMEALCSSETSVLTRATRLNIPGDVVLHRSTYSHGGTDKCLLTEAESILRDQESLSYSKTSDPFMEPEGV